MKLIVGLGNPGKDYKKTKHNAGFIVVDEFALSHDLIFKEKFNGLYSEYNLGKEKAIFLKPLCFMNLSGGVVAKYVNYFDIDINDVLIIYDDIAFDFGEYKIRKNGSSGGHNGMNDIIKALKTENINRIKIGIGKNEISLDKYVLTNFSVFQTRKINNLVPKIIDIINDFILSDIDTLMSKYNVKEKNE